MFWKHTVVLAAMMAMLSGFESATAQVPDGEASSHGDRHHRTGRQARGPMSPDRMIRVMTRRLGLDETQVQQVTNIVESARPEFELLRENGKANRDALRELNVADPDYGADVQDIARVRGELAASSVELRGRLRAEIHAILTPEQQEKLAATDRERFRGGRHQRWDRRPDSSPELDE